MRTIVLYLAAAFLTKCAAFAPASTLKTAAATTTKIALYMAIDKDLLRRAKEKRSADVDDRVVELKRPLGLVLNEDDSGNVYVETVAPRGNAARTGSVKEGDVLTMCSATFGEQMWSCRGVGLSRVLAAIRVRSGATVRLAFESPQESVRKAKVSARAAQAAQEAKARAKDQKDLLPKQLQSDDKKLKKGKFLGLF